MSEATFHVVQFWCHPGRKLKMKQKTTRKSTASNSPILVHHAVCSSPHRTGDHGNDSSEFKPSKRKQERDHRKRKEYHALRKSQKPYYCPFTNFLLFISLHPSPSCWAAELSILFNSIPLTQREYYLFLNKIIYYSRIGASFVASCLDRLFIFFFFVFYLVEQSKMYSSLLKFTTLALAAINAVHAHTHFSEIYVDGNGYVCLD